MRESMIDGAVRVEFGAVTLTAGHCPTCLLARTDVATLFAGVHQWTRVR